MSDEYASSFFRPTIMVRFVHNMMPRFGKSDSFADLFSNDKVDQTQYFIGVVMFPIIFLSLMFVWSMVILVLKCYPRRFGCASGRSFEPYNNATIPQKEPSSPEPGENNHEAMFSSSRSDVHTDIEEGSRSGSSHASSEHNSEEIHDNNNNHSEEENQTEEGESSQPYDENDDQFETIMIDDPQIMITTPRTKRPKRNLSVVIRERRTRFLFSFFGTIIFLASTCLLIFVYTPMVTVKLEEETALVETKAILEEANALTESMRLASIKIVGVRAAVPPDLSQLCPNMVHDTIESDLSLSGMLEFLNMHMNVINVLVEEDVDYAQKEIDAFQKTVDTVEKAKIDSKKYAIAIPVIAIFASVVVVAALCMVFFSWTTKSPSKGLQYITTTFILPALLLLALLCCVATCASAVGATMINDACMGGPSPGSPDATAIEILNARSIPEGSALYRVVENFTNGCKNPEPVEFVSQYKDTLGDNIETIWRYVASIDSVGIETLNERCGQSLDGLMDAARVIARNSNYVVKGIQRTPNTMSCRRVNPIYIETVHRSLCYNTASGVSWLFIMLLIVSISVMAMITLRASLLQSKEWEDPSKTQEVLFFDEHKEYLKYIGKYQHEWEEFGGLAPSEMQSPANTNSHVTASEAFGRSQYSRYQSTGSVWSAIDEEAPLTDSDSSIEIYSISRSGSDPLGTTNGQTNHSSSQRAPTNKDVICETDGVLLTAISLQSHESDEMGFEVVEERKNLHFNLERQKGTRQGLTLTELGLGHHDIEPEATSLTSLPADQDLLSPESSQRCKACLPVLAREKICDQPMIQYPHHTVGEIGDSKLPSPFFRGNENDTNTIDSESLIFSLTETECGNTEASNSETKGETKETISGNGANEILADRNLRTGLGTHCHEEMEGIAQESDKMGAFSKLTCKVTSGTQVIPPMSPISVSVSRSGPFMDITSPFLFAAESATENKKASQARSTGTLNAPQPTVPLSTLHFPSKRAPSNKLIERMRVFDKKA
eukprot:CAMPEP_0198286856 /NCGR_PEP_ID=MMETSP1449-20131203/5819_1 /TAXON_ID=420275 /ORGANISM="Attheya septentrionalis, Strain CCMP2084" /LENGTH=1004 /DNA_ID=CAMNT_0043984683 /DNA_START=148 /DNA_END=3162 /DNA_ORIENTATION=+